MKIEINGNSIRIKGPRNVDLIIYAHSEKDYDRFSMSLVYDGFEHGIIPSIEVAGNHIVMQNNNEKGRILIK